MSRTSQSVRRQLQRLIARFKFEELELAVLPIFPELTWNNLRSLLMKHHQNFTTRASISIIEQIITTAKIGNNDLRDRLSILEVIEVSRHSNQRIWTCHELRGETVTMSGFQSDSEIRDRVAKEFLRSVQNMEVQITSYNGITFLTLRSSQRSTSRRVKNVETLYFAFCKGEKYFFSGKKNMGKNYLLAMAQALGYTNTKPSKLSGRDLKSLIKLLRAKQQGAMNSKNISLPPVYPGLQPVVRSTGIDFTESKQRGEYIDKCFGTEAPKTEMLAVNIASEVWDCPELVPEMEGESGICKWEFHSTYIPGMMKKLVQRRVLTIPLPIYVQDMLIIGRNETTLRSY
ncbi:uncharacterized protein LOC124176879 isoform X1 [Neodiprion fabricii]|uniref:uncharacterized protein LOC124176879 isoform X1 n=2 Tax=Neodiprion fabricii TaxID=2872261 RepID=UPI001ED962F3|nr:uncharacterized protein LOC124176879 isoform X1 [Neodiprion fabricii]